MLSRPLEASLPDLQRPVGGKEAQWPAYQLQWHPVLEHADNLYQQESWKGQRWLNALQHALPPPPTTATCANTRIERKNAEQSVMCVRGQYAPNDNDLLATPHLVTVAGIAFPKRVVPFNGERASMVPVNTAESNLRACMLALCQASPVLLEGPAGCGKTILIEELMHRTGNVDAVRIHLDDQIDSKTLLGTYVCTDIPGQFVWRAGALTRAMQEVFSLAYAVFVRAHVLYFEDDVICLHRVAG